MIHTEKPLLKFITVNIIAAILWLPPLISQLFSPRLFKATPFFHNLAVLCGFHFFVLYMVPKPSYS